MPPKQRTRGTAGTAIIWKDDLDSIITPLNAGSDRTIAVQVISEEQPILLLNTYMPTEGAAQAVYEEILDEVYTIMDQYSEHAVIWSGDINASPDRINKTTNDVKLKNFCIENGLQISCHMPKTPTFHHFNGKSQSQIDLFLERPSENKIRRIKVSAREPTNTGPHDPVTAEIVILITDQQQAPLAMTAKPKAKVKWEKS